MEIDEIKKQINNSDILLLGLGSGFYRNSEVPEDPKDWEKIKKYNRTKNNFDYYNNKIARMLKDKDYFILTTSYDSNLRKYIDNQRLFTPNGDSSLLQCFNSCKNDLWDFNQLRFMQYPPVCPFCGSPLIMNIATDAFFINERYRDEETRYYNWIHKNYTKKMLIVEIETDEDGDKRSLRDPFENIAAALPDATLIRVNSGNQNIPPSLNRGISYKESVDSFLEKLFS